MNAIFPLPRRDVLVSVRPEYASKIIAGDKTVELRRRFPESSATGAIALIYSSRPVCAVIGHPRIDTMRRLPVRRIWAEHLAAACISKPDFDAYFAGASYGFAILLDKITPIDRHLTVNALRELGIIPPQSYRYIS